MGGRKPMTAPSQRLPLITVVCPVFNEEASIPLFYERLLNALKPIEGKVLFEFLFVNNRSSDGSLELLRRLRTSDPRINIITMSRNFGYQASITAGMRHARGDAVVNIDVDCEDPPELIPRFVERWLEGADITYGIRQARQEFYLMHLARKLFYRLTRRVADHEIILDMAEFFLADRRVCNAALATRSTFPFVRGQVGYVGFRREGIPYKRGRRVTGRTHYNLYGAVRFGIAGILSSSTLPLRILAYAGLLGFLADIVGMALILGGAGPPALKPGERWLLVIVLIHLAWMLLAFGAIGVYLARVYKDVIGLPLYVIDERMSSIDPSPPVRP